MGGYAAFVFLESADNYQNQVRSKMAPYATGLKVKPWMAECICVGTKARSEAFVAGQKALGTDINKLRDDYHEMSPDARPDWDVYITPLRTKVEEMEKAHPMFKKPDPECHQCKGEGKFETRSNPNGNWDRWELFEDDPNNLIHKISAIDQNTQVFVVITPDGKWNQRPPGLTSEEWSNQLKEYYKEFADHYSVAVWCKYSPF